MSSQISPDCVGLALVDDGTVALAHLESYFSDVEDFATLTATRSPRVVLRLTQSHQIDVLITDVHMEHMDGVETTWEVLRLSPSTWIILLTTVDTDGDLLQGLGVGASGFLLKNVLVEETIAAVRTVRSGVKVVAPTPTTCLIDYVLTSVCGADGSVHLFQRERDVLHFLCEEVSNRETASLLVIAETTVKSHITGLFHKTGTVSCLEIMVWTFEYDYASNSSIATPAASVPGGSTPGSAVS